MSDKKIYRVYARDTEDTDYPCRESAFYETELGKAEFIAELEDAHEGTIEIVEIVEYTLQDVLNLLNLYIE